MASEVLLKLIDASDAGRLSKSRDPSPIFPPGQGRVLGLIVGSLNGFFVTVIGIPSFLVTLGTMQFVRGLDMRVT